MAVALDLTVRMTLDTLGKLGGKAQKAGHTILREVRTG